VCEAFAQASKNRGWRAWKGMCRIALNDKEEKMLDIIFSDDSGRRTLRTMSGESL